MVVISRSDRGYLCWRIVLLFCCFVVFICIAHYDVERELHIISPCATCCPFLTNTTPTNTSFTTSHFNCTKYPTKHLPITHQVSHHTNPTTYLSLLVWSAKKCTEFKGLRFFIAKSILASERMMSSGLIVTPPGEQTHAISCGVGTFHTPRATSSAGTRTSVTNLFRVKWVVVGVVVGAGSFVCGNGHAGGNSQIVYHKYISHQH